MVKEYSVVHGKRIFYAKRIVCTYIDNIWNKVLMV